MYSPREPNARPAVAKTTHRAQAPTSIAHPQHVAGSTFTSGAAPGTSSDAPGRAPAQVEAERAKNGPVTSVRDAKVPAATVRKDRDGKRDRK